MRRLRWIAVAGLLLGLALWWGLRGSSPAKPDDSTGPTSQATPPASTPSHQGAPASTRLFTDAGPEEAHRLKLEVTASTGETVDDYEANLRALESGKSVEWDDPDEAPFARDLAPGRYTLHVEASDYADQDLTVDLPAPENTIHVRLISTWAEISGEIVTQGRISEDATLGADIADEMSGSSGEGTIDPDRHFRIRVSRPGKFRVEFHDDALGAASMEVLAPAKNVRLVPTRGAGVRLRIRGAPPLARSAPARSEDPDDDDDSSSLEGSISALEDSETYWDVELTDIADRHEIWGLPAGPAKIDVSIGEQSVHQQVTLRDGVLTDAELVFHPKRVIEGRVLDSAGRPLSGASVEVGDDEQRTEDDGRFHFEDQPHGDTLELSHLGYSPLTVPVGSGHLGDLVLTALTPRHLTGRVHGSAGERIPHFTVRTMGTDYVQTIDTVGGDFSIDVPPEPQQFLFEADGFDRRSVFVHPRQSTLDVVLVAARDIEGTVLSASGAPVAGAAVYCSNGGNQATTDANGHFRLASYGKGQWVAASTATGSAVGQSGDEPIVLRLAELVSFHATVPATAGRLALLGTGPGMELPIAPDGTVSATIPRGRYAFLLEPTEDEDREFLIAPDGSNALLLDAASVNIVLRSREGEPLPHFKAHGTGTAH